jgi:hypothetical protein
MEYSYPLKNCYIATTLNNNKLTYNIREYRCSLILAKLSYVRYKVISEYVDHHIIFIADMERIIVISAKNKKIKIFYFHKNIAPSDRKDLVNHTLHICEDYKNFDNISFILTTKQNKKDLYLYKPNAKYPTELGIKDKKKSLIFIDKNTIIYHKNTQKQFYQLAKYNISNNIIQKNDLMTIEGHIMISKDKKYIIVHDIISNIIHGYTYEGMALKYSTNISFTMTDGFVIMDNDLNMRIFNFHNKLQNTIKLNNKIIYGDFRILPNDKFIMLKTHSKIYFIDIMRGYKGYIDFVAENAMHICENYIIFKNTNDFKVLDLRCLNSLECRKSFILGSLNKNSSIDKFMNHYLFDYHLLYEIMEYVPVLHK